LPKQPFENLTIDKRTSIKVAIVEDDAGIRESLAILINGAAGIRCIGTYPNAKTALKEFPRDWPEVVLMDINLPEMSGIEAVAKIKEIHPATNVMMFTVYEDSEQIFQSLQAGASGYLIKETPPGEVLEAVADVHRGGSPMSSHVARKVVRFFQQQKPVKEPVVSEMAHLSPRENEILNFLTKGFRYKEIADELGISVLTVRSHLRRIYEKLQVRSRTEAAVKFLGNMKRDA
jgi:RNA polymerase sigma factor (sigma-70 family)